MVYLICDASLLMTEEAFAASSYASHPFLKDLETDTVRAVFQDVRHHLRLSNNIMLPGNAGRDINDAWGYRLRYLPRLQSLEELLYRPLPTKGQ